MLRPHCLSSNKTWLTTVTEKKENPLERFGITRRFFPEDEPYSFGHDFNGKKASRQLVWPTAFFLSLLLLLTLDQFLLDTDFAIMLLFEKCSVKAAIMLICFK